MKTLTQSLRLLAALTIITGGLYPLGVWAVGQLFFKDKAEGSLLFRQGKLVGSALLAQKNDDPRYFTSRPSAGDFATVASGASNQAWSSARLVAAIAGRRVAHGNDAPVDLLTASGSGLDPHLSVKAVRFQVARVAGQRKLSDIQRNTLDELVARHVESGHFGPSRINILNLNLALDAAFPPQ